MSNRPCLQKTVAAVAIALASAAIARADVEQNPLREVFPYGVYVGGDNPEYGAIEGEADLKEMIDRVCADLAAHHMNCAWPNNLDLAGDVLPLWLEAGRKHGVRIIPQGGGPPGLARPRWFEDKYDFARKVEPLYKALAEKYGDAPALLAWSLAEENPPEQWFYEAIGDVTLKMAEWDPKHPVITMDNKAATAWLNAEVVKPKALTRDVYVFFVDGLNGPYTPVGFRSLLRRECVRFREAAESAGGVYWIMGQGMQIVNRGPGVEQAVWRYPTEEEMRWQVWAAVQQGAKGFFFFYYRGPKDRASGEFIEGLRDRQGKETAQFRMASEVGRQLKPLMPLLLELDVAPPHQEVVYWENTPVTGQTFVHRQTGQRFLVVVNHDCTNIQRVGIELGYFPRFLDEKDRLFDLRSGRAYGYQTIKLTTLLPGDGTVYFVGTDDEWQAFSADAK